jgi:hypothetical protein
VQVDLSLKLYVGEGPLVGVGEAMKPELTRSINR